MKTILLTTIALFYFVSESKSQANKSVFLELGGNGIFLSGNFDARFTKSEKGLGYRVGLGFIPAFDMGNADILFPSTPTILIVPVGINHLAGKAPNYFESGIGFTYAYTSGYFSSDFWGYRVHGTGSSLLFIPSIGYRYAGIGDGLQLRICFTPIISKVESGLYAGVSAGYKF